MTGSRIQVLFKSQKRVPDHVPDRVIDLAIEESVTEILHSLGILRM